MLRREGLEHEDSLDIPNASVLLNGELLERLVFLLGLAVFWKAIASEIRGERVRRIKSLIGEEGYRFALKKAPFVLVKTANLETKDSEGQKTALAPRLDDLDDLPKKCTLVGLAILKKAVEPLSSENRARLQLKFSRSLGGMWDAGILSPISKDEALRLIERILKLEGERT
jgi:hypothetical protein